MSGWIVLIILLIILFIVLINNRLVNLENGVKNAFSTIDVYLKKRFDLIPSLVNIVKSHMKYEKETLHNLLELRNLALNGDMAEKISKDLPLTRNIDKVIVLSENYPELQASESFQSLIAAIIDVEAEISAGRRAYNASVNNFNVAVQQFPTNIVARLLGYTTYPYFETEDSQRQNKKIDI